MSPRAFTDGEREQIRQRLLGVAADHFARYGYRRANLAEIAREVGIGKGTLYLFVESKAGLFLEVVAALEARMRVRLLEEMRQPFPSPRARLHRFLSFQAEALSQQPLLAVLVTPEEAAALMREVPAEVMEGLRADDEAFYAALAEQWQREGQVAAVDPRTLAALPRALFALMLQRELIGEQVFPEVAGLIIDSLSDALVPKGSPDEEHS